MSTNYQRIAQLKRKEVSNRKIAEMLKMSRNTVNRITVAFAESGFSYAQIEEMSLEEIEKLIPKKEIAVRESEYVSPDYESLSKELARPGVSMTLLWEEYMDNCRRSGRQGYQRTQFLKYFREYLSNTKFTEVIHHKAGEEIEVDWNGKRPSWADPDTGEIVYGWMFVGVLSFSGYAFAWVTPDMKTPSWIDAHNRMYKYFGGVTKILVPDNLKTGVTSHGKDEVVLNETYSNMADYYGTVVIPARVRHPKDKPLAENSVQKLTSAIMGRMRDYQFFSIGEYNAQLLIELDKFNKKPFQKKEGSRYSVFMDYEKDVLLPLPAEPYELCEWKKAKVQANGHISLRKNYYSVPYKFIGKEVDVKIANSYFEVYFNNRLLCKHRLLKGSIGRYETDEAHLPANASHYGDWNSTRYLNWAKSKGPHTYRVIFKLFEGEKIEQKYYRAAHSILKLADKWSDERLENACQYALTVFSRPTYQNIKNIITSSEDLKALDESEKTETAGGIFVRGGDYYGD